jgi:flagellar basal-body rod protein FlgC
MFPLIHKILHVALSGMQVQSQRLLVLAQNIANAGTRAPTPTTLPYQRKTVSFASMFDKKKGVEVVYIKKINRDPTPFPVIYSPGDPGADDNGYVKEANVKTTVELTDSMETKRGYDANLKAYEKALAMQQSALDLLRGGR